LQFPTRRLILWNNHWSGVLVELLEKYYLHLSKFWQNRFQIVTKSRKLTNVMLFLKRSERRCFLSHKREELLACKSSFISRLECMKWIGMDKSIAKVDVVLATPGEAYIGAKDYGLIPLAFEIVGTEQRKLLSKSGISPMIKIDFIFPYIFG
jgi:hypothetical protein